MPRGLTSPLPQGALRGASPRTGLPAEGLRLAFLAGAVLWFYSPYFTGTLLGGVDARWYATMLAEYLHQLRAGHLPVLAGAGAIDWCGGIHPFRSAPMYTAVAGVWDCLTFGQLSVFRLQHLTVLTSALVGTLGFYGLAGSLLPGRRWEAVLVTLLYLTTPAWMTLITGAEAYMSFMTFAVMPLMLYGNIRAVRRADAGGFTALAAGLALLWMCHPPIAGLSTLASAGIQVFALASAPTRPALGALARLLWFPALALFYFAAMSEVPTVNDPMPLVDLSIVVGMGVFVFGFIRGGLREGERFWLIAAAAGLVVVGVFSRPWFFWALGTAGLASGGMALLRRQAAERAPRWAADVAFGAFLVAAALLDRVLDPVVWNREEGPVFGQLSNNREFLPGLVSLYSGMVSVRFGIGVVGAIGAGLIGAYAVKDRTARLLGCAVVALVLAMFHVPHLSEFLVGYFPPYLAGVTSLGMGLRLMPVIVSLGLAGFVLVYAQTADWPGGLRVAVRVGLVAAAGLGLFQADLYRRVNLTVIAPAARSAMLLRTENIPTFRFDYDLTLTPNYLTDGVDDPRLQLRLVDQRGRAILDARQAAAVSESAHPLGRIDLVLGGQEELTGRIPVAPGQRLLVRFEFPAGRVYNGWLFFYGNEGVDGYREYYLPCSGLRFAFGTDAANPHILTLWNSTDRLVTYRLAYRPFPGSTIHLGDRLATAVVSAWDQGIEPVSLESLTPLKVTVRAPRAGFLETCRVFLPGYRATVDGVDVPVGCSPRRLVQVPVAAGTHVVAVRLGLTALELASLTISAVAWLALGFTALRAARAPAA